MKFTKLTRGYNGVLPFAFILLMLLVVQQSCKKIDSNGMIINDPKAITKFLTVPADSNPTVLRIINTVKHQEEKYHFLNSIIAHEGYVLWGQAHILPASDLSKDTIVLIPLVLANTQYVNSFISCRVNDTVAIKLYKGREYASFGFGKNPDSINANKIAFTCISFEYEMFQHSKFNIKDKRLFNYLPRDNEFAKNTLTIRPPSLRTWITVTFSYETEELYENPFDVWTPDGYASQWTHTVTHYYNQSVWIADFGNWDGATFPEDPWATTGGQGGGGTNPPCGTNCNAVVDNWEVVNDPPPAPPFQIVKKDSSFANTKLDCVYENLKLNNSFFNSLNNTFDGVKGNALYFNITNIPDTNIFLMTRGFGGNRFAISGAPQINNYSNLFKMLGLTHELIHARFYYSLELAGLLSYDINGDALLDTSNGNMNLNLVHFDALADEAERLRILINQFNISCGLPNSPISQNNWCHALFNSASFDANVYRTKLKDMLFEKGDWDNQPPAFINHMAATLGTNWKNKLSEYMSWFGLNDTPGFSQFLIANNLSEQQFQDIIYYTRDNANKNCQ